MSKTIILRHLSPQWIVTNSFFQSAPNVHWFHLAMLMTKTNPSVTFPSLLHNPSGNFATHYVQSLTFQVPLAPLSREIHPLAMLLQIGRYTNQGISLPQNHHTGHSMLMPINGHYWVPVPHNDPILECFTSILLHISILFCCKLLQ